MTLSRILVPAAAALAAVAVGLAVHAGQPEPAARTAPVPTAPRATVSVSDPGVGEAPSAASGTSAPTPRDKQPAEQPSAEGLAAAAVVAYTEYSWRDEEPTTWIERTAALATPRYRRELDAARKAVESSWDADVMAEHRSARTEVESVVVSGMHENTRRRVTYTVTYYSAAKIGDAPWTQPVEPLSRFVTLVATPAGWKVDRVVSTADRS